MADTINICIDKLFLFSSCIILVLAVLVLLSFSSGYAQNVTDQKTQWFEPLDLGKLLRIKCFNGSYAEFVSDCSSPSECQSLRMAGNDTLECVPATVDKEKVSK